jgi:hypothetical protein
MARMERAETTPETCANASSRARQFRPARFIVWLAVSLAWAAALAWLAVQAAAHFAPLLVFPTAVGLLLGWALALALRLTNTVHRPSVLAGTVLAGAVVIVGQHYASYLTARSVEPSAATALAAQAFPELGDRLKTHERTFRQFLQDSAAHGQTLGSATLSPTGVWLLWGADALMTLAVALFVVRVALRHPFCDACGTWYRVTRAGQTDAATSTALATLSGCKNPSPGAAKYELANCRGGCGPTAFKLSWSGSGRRSFSTWLDRAALAEVIALIDGNERPKQPSCTSTTPTIANAER